MLSRFRISATAELVPCGCLSILLISDNGILVGTASIVLVLLHCCCLFMSQQHSSVYQRRTCSYNCRCCHIVVEVADQTLYLTQSQYTDTGPTNSSADPLAPGTWRGDHWSTNFEVTSMTQPGKRSTAKMGSSLRSATPKSGKLGQICHTQKWEARSDLPHSKVGS